MAKKEQTWDEFLNSFLKFKDLPKETQDKLAKNAQDSKDRAYKRYSSGLMTWEEYGRLCEWEDKNLESGNLLYALKMARTMGFAIAKINKGIVTCN